MWFSEKVSKIDKPVARLNKEKKRMQITNIRNETGNITTNLINIKRIIKKCYEHLYAHKFENLNEMD